MKPLTGSASRFRRLRGAALLAVVLAALGAVLGSTSASAAVSASLTRYPYLTDSVQTSTTVNWATAATGTAGSVRWGPAGGTCDTQTTAATRTAITVNSLPEYQWKAVLPVFADTSYCYRIFLDSTDLLGSDPRTGIHLASRAELDSTIQLRGVR